MGGGGEETSLTYRGAYCAFIVPTLTLHPVYSTTVFSYNL